MNYILLILCSILLPAVYSKTYIKPKPKLCIQCKHFIPDDDNGRFGKCSLFPRVEGKINYLVNGENEGEYYYCSTARNSPRMCGEEGKHYKKKGVDTCSKHMESLDP
jgi:hypothetical protein